MDNSTLIQSYVLSRWFVSTIRRRSSVQMADPPHYYETLTWEWDPETKKRGKLIEQEEASDYRRGGFESHAEVCRELIEGAEE